jgi:fucose 4-O-acetylase-like acetyltransferase
VIQLGQASLLVYWVHIEFVYGKLSILPKRAETIPIASAALLLITVSMVLLAALRTRTKGRAIELRALLREALRPVLSTIS